MKTETSLSKSIAGANKDAIRECTQMLNDLRLLQKGDYARLMPRIRATLSVVTQRVHEASAYHNALTTA